MTQSDVDEALIGARRFVAERMRGPRYLSRATVFV